MHVSIGMWLMALLATTCKYVLYSISFSMYGEVLESGTHVCIAEHCIIVSAALYRFVDLAALRYACLSPSAFA